MYFLNETLLILQTSEGGHRDRPRSHKTIWLSCLAVWLCVANWALMSPKFYNVLFSFGDKLSKNPGKRGDVIWGTNSCMKQQARPVSDLSKCKTDWLAVTSLIEIGVTHCIHIIMDPKSFDFNYPFARSNGLGFQPKCFKKTYSENMHNEEEA